MSIAALIRAMTAAGAPPEAIALAVDAIEAKDAELRRKKDIERDRKRHYRKIGWRIPEKQWLDLRDKVIARDGYVCAYCLSEEGPFSIDHIWPVSRGGSHELTNMTVACTHCNSSKGSKTLEEWRGHNGDRA